MSEKIVEITLPKLGESITEATLLDWQVREGDLVEKGQFILEVATDKVNSEIVAPADGKVLEILVETDEVVSIGTVLGQIDTSVEVAKKTSETTLLEKEGQKAKVSSKKVSQAISKGKKSNVRHQPISSGTAQEYLLPRRDSNRFYSPLVEKIALENHISYSELARIPGSGVDGRVRKSDIFNYLEEGRPAQFIQSVPLQQGSNFQIPDLKFDRGKGRVIEMDRMRQMIADHMVYSKHVSPHVTAYVEADMTQMVNWRKAHKTDFLRKYNQKLTFTPLFIEAVTQAIRDFPRINSSLEGKNIIEKEEISIGMATALPDGNLIVPVVQNTNNKNLPELAEEVNRLAEKARNNQLSAEDTRGGTFTISNVGTFGSLMGTPIINQPEAAILATGIIKKQAEVMEYDEGDKIEIRQMMYLSLSFDHRIIDGFLAGSFLRRVADYFEGKDMEWGG